MIVSASLTGREFVRIQRSSMQYHLTVTWNSSTAKRAGKADLPQIRSILDDKGQDVTHLIDVDKTYPNLESLQNELAQKLGMETDEVVLTEVS